MKKILIGAILTSSLAMSGDLEKCTHAILMMDKIDIQIKKEKENSRRHSKHMRDSKKKQKKEEMVDIVGGAIHKSELRLFDQVRHEWLIVRQKECADIQDKANTNSREKKDKK